MAMSHMRTFVRATATTVSQFANLLFLERPLLAQYQYNDVLRGIQGPYSLNPKWLSRVALGHVGKVDMNDDGLRVTKTNKGQVQLMALASIKYDDHTLLPSQTEHMLISTLETFLAEFPVDSREYEFY